MQWRSAGSLHSQGNGGCSSFISPSITLLYIIASTSQSQNIHDLFTGEEENSKIPWHIYNINESSVKTAHDYFILLTFASFKCTQWQFFFQFFPHLSSSQHTFSWINLHRCWDIFQKFNQPHAYLFQFGTIIELENAIFCIDPYVSIYYLNRKNKTKNSLCLSKMLKSLDKSTSFCDNVSAQLFLPPCSD